MSPFAVLPPASLTSAPSMPAAPMPVCTPGREGIPHGLLGRIMCGDLLPHDLVGGHASLRQLVLAYAPHAGAVLATLVAVRLAWWRAQRNAWRDAAARARWLEIVAPVSATPVTTVALWRLLADLLPAPRRLTLRARRLVWEVHATPSGMRCGIWVPPGINPTAVARKVHSAWPGARVRHASRPVLPEDGATVGRRLAPTRPEWLALVDEDVLAPVADRSVVSRSAVDAQADRLRALFDAIAAAGRARGALLQVVIGRAPGWRTAVAHTATRDPGAARRTRRTGAARAADLLLRLLLAVLRMVLDLIQPGGSKRTSATAGTRLDERMAEQARAARRKYAAKPLLLVGVRVVTTGETRGAACDAADGVMSGFKLLSTHLRPVRLARPAAAALWRSAAEAQLMLATVAEVAALAGVPGEPSAYGLPGAASRRRAVGRDTWHTARRTPDPGHPDMGPDDAPDLW